MRLAVGREASGLHESRLWALDSFHSYHLPYTSLLFSIIFNRFYSRNLGAGECFAIGAEGDGTDESLVGLQNSNIACRPVFQRRIFGLVVRCHAEAMQLCRPFL